MSIKKGDIIIDFKKIAGLALIAIMVFVIFTWLVLFPTVGPTEYGLEISNIDNKVNKNKVYEAGRYPIPWARFIKFPKIAQTIEFSADEDADAGILTSRTQDGLSVNLEVSFQYKLNKESIFDLFKDFGTNYESIFVRIARDDIRDVTGNYTAIEFFNQRDIIGDKMFQSLLQTLEDNHATVTNLQLRGVDLPDSFENAIEQAEVARRQIEIATFEQQAAVIRAQTYIIEAQAQANITILEAEASAEAFLINIKAQAEGINITLTQEALSYYALAQQMGFNSTEILTYLWIQAIMMHESSLLIIGSSTPLLQIPVNSTGG